MKIGDPVTSATSATEPVLQFARAADWHLWLASHHDASSGALLRIAKKGARKSITYAEALDGALAWGWIDSQKRALDANAWLQRFTPRKARSPWSKINRAKAAALMAAGAMAPPGLAEVARAKRDGRWERVYDGARASSVPRDLAAALARNARARAFFGTLAARTAMRSSTRARDGRRGAPGGARSTVAMCARQETIHPRASRVRGNE
jgi:uncharacterized protein YdeI (YjbR/CyaY-like superfamily)